jgi:uncharacterized protein YodC (DUF2158 family)
MHEFEIGDTVRLKSGGPLMTIHNIGDFTPSGGPNPGLLCVWFDGQKRVEDICHPKTVELERDDG